MKSYSPYENAPEGADGEAGAGAASTRSLQRQSSRRFPRIFATTSMNDTRVLYVEPLKWVSRLQAAGIDAIIKIEVEAGHGGTSPLQAVARSQLRKRLVPLRHGVTR